MQRSAMGDLSTDYEYNNELWLLSVGKNDKINIKALEGTWTILSMDSDSQEMPAKRDHQTMSYDHASKSVYVFGGRTSPDMLSPNTVLNDLWKFDLVSKTWIQVCEQMNLCVILFDVPKPKRTLPKLVCSYLPTMN